MAICAGCRRDVPAACLTHVQIEVCRQTWSSPAESDVIELCPECVLADERDPDYERANGRFKAQQGSEL